MVANEIKSPVKLSPVHNSENPGSGGSDPQGTNADIETVLERSETWTPLNFGEVWDHRELLYFLIWRDLKVRYKQTILGTAWVVLQPLLMTLIFTVVLGHLARVPSDDVPYPLFYYSGFTIWVFFSGAVSITGNCLVGNAHLITKVYFPRLIIPIASILARLVDLFVSLVILAGLMAYYRVPVGPGILLAPVVIVIVALLALGFGMWTSAVNVRYRDVGLALPVLIQLWMFVSPIVYPLNLVPVQWRLLYSLNPLVGILDGFRASLFGTPLNLPAIFISTGFTLALLLYSAYSFRSREREFADVI